MIVFVFDTKKECDKFTFLYEKYYKMVLYTILRFIDDKFLAEDLLNEIYILIGKNLDKIDLSNERRSRNYIITIARNYTKSFLRKQNDICEDFIEDSNTMKDNSDDILKEIIKKEELHELTKEISNLEDKYKIVLELKYINGFSDIEIANFLQIKVKTVQMRLYRSKRILRSKLEASR